MNVAVYTRVSTERQSTEGFSLEAQHDRLLENVKSNGWTLFKIYTDPGESAKDLKRPGVQQMIIDLKSGLFDAVLVHKLDRLTRNISDLYDLVELVNARNVKLISLSENIDTSTPMGRMFVYILGIFAQMFRENLREEVIKGMTKRAEKGLHNVTVNLYGYQRDENGQLLIVEDEAKWVKWIFDQYIGGKGTTNIAKELNHLSIRRNQGARWDQHKVMMTITNLHYTGMVHWKVATAPEDSRIVRQGVHEPIVTMEVYEKAQRILERRREGTISLNSYDYVFGGIIKCGKCGASYQAKYNKRKLKDGTPAMYRGYSCANNDKHGTCDQSGISEDNMVKLLFANFEIIGGLPDKFESQIVKDNGLADLERALKQSELKRSRWQHAYGEGLMNYEDFAKRMKEETEHVKELNKQLAEVAPTHSPTISPDEALNTFRFIRDNWELIGQLERKQVIQALIQKIIILKNESWSISELITV